jgi:hypothetical protein
MKSICGTDCDNCQLKNNCKGCKETNGCPFGRKCFIANYIEIGGHKKYNEFKNQLVKEINELNIEGIPKIDELYALNGSFVNMKYPLPNGKIIDFLDNNEIYLGNQVECEFNDDEIKKCYGIVANPSFILICKYGENGSNPEIIIYKRR